MKTDMPGSIPRSKKIAVTLDKECNAIIPPLVNQHILESDFLMN